MKKKILETHEKTREISFSKEKIDADCLISNGGKHALFNLFGALINPGDEVILISPYWTSYPELVKICGGIPNIIKTFEYDVFVPDLEKIGQAINSRTKAIVINSPHNPTGIHYTQEWMEGFANLMNKHPEVTIISDEIYYPLYYFDPPPTYYYQTHPNLLKQTVIIDGISKFFASTGLRIGWAIAPKELITE